MPACDILPAFALPINGFMGLLPPLLLIAAFVFIDAEQNQEQLDQRAYEAQADAELRAKALAAGVRVPTEMDTEPLIREIKRWGDDVAVMLEPVFKTGVPARFGLALFDVRGERLVPFAEVECDTYDDVAYSPAVGRLLACAVGGEGVLFQRAGDGWHRRARVQRGRGVRVIASDHWVVLASERALTILDAETFAAAAVVNGPALSVPTPPRALLLDGDMLLVGYDGGEFGGGLFGCDLARGERTLNQLLRENVNALLRTRTGYVWATAGTSHMGGVHGSLYRLGGGYSPEVVTTNSGYVDTGSSDPNQTRQGVPLPGLTEIIGLAEDDGGNPVVALPPYGVFAMDGTAFMPLYSGALKFTYPVEIWLAGRSMGVLVSSSPVSVMRRADGRVFVATRSLGIFELPRDGRTSKLKQITFTTPDRR